MMPAAAAVFHVPGAARGPLILAIVAGTIQRTIDADIVTFWGERFGLIAGVLSCIRYHRRLLPRERAARRPRRSLPPHARCAPAAATGRDDADDQPDRTEHHEDHTQRLEAHAGNRRRHRPGEDRAHGDHEE